MGEARIIYLHFPDRRVCVVCGVVLAAGWAEGRGGNSRTARAIPHHTPCPTAEGGGGGCGGCVCVCGGAGDVCCIRTTRTPSFLFPLESCAECVPFFCVPSHQCQNHLPSPSISPKDGEGGACGRREWSAVVWCSPACHSNICVKGGKLKKCVRPSADGRHALWAKKVRWRVCGRA